MPAFLAARAAGADGIELDVHLTADGAVVVHHDFEVPGHGSIAQLASTQLPDWLPSLEEALEACWPLGVNIEIKHESPDGAADGDLLASEVARLVTARREADRVVVSSFHLPAIDAVRACAPSLATALLIEPVSDPMASLETASRHGHAGLHPFFLAVDAALVRAAAQADIAIRAWTVNDPGAVAVLAVMGVEAVITDDVPAALRALGRG